MKDSKRSSAVDSSIDQRGKRLHDPALSNRAFAVFFIVTVLIALTLLLAPQAGAASATWDGSSSTVWGLTDNWTPQTIPGSGDTATFNNSGNGNTTLNLGSGVTINTILFDTSSAAAYTIGSGAVDSQTLTLNFSGAITVNSTVTNNQLFNATVRLGTDGGSGGSFTFTNNSTTALLTIAGNVSQFTSNSNNPNRTLNLSGSGNGVISGIINGNGNSSGSNAQPAVSIVKTGAGTWTLSGANIYTGTTSITGGVLSVNMLANGGVASPIGASTVSGTNLLISGGTLKYTGSGHSTNRDYGIGVNGATFDASGTGAVNFTSGGAVGYLGTGSRTFTLTGTNTGANTLTQQIGNPSGGSTSLVKDGNGSWTIAGPSGYTGTTTINAGTLTVNDAPGVTSAGALSGTTSITVNSGGTLALSGDSTVTTRINNSAGITLNGGTFRLSGVSEGATGAGGVGVGALTLSSSSVIDLASTSLLHLAASNLQTWTGTLSIWNWNGTPITGGGAEQILFGTNATGLTAAQLLQVQFYSGSGTGAFAPGALILLTGEIVPVPEPATWISGALVLGLIGWTQRRRMRALLAR